MSAKRKLNSRSGFTLAETLLAVLILLLVSGIVTAGIPSARKAYVDVVIGANAQSLLTTTANALREEIGTAWGVECKDNVLTYYSASTGALSTLECRSEGDGGIYIQEYTSISIENFTGYNINEKKSVGQARLLVSAETATKDLTVGYDNVTYADGIVTFEKIWVKHDDSELAKLDGLKIRVFSVTPTPTPTTVPTP